MFLEQGRCVGQHLLGGGGWALFLALRGLPAVRWPELAHSAWLGKQSWLVAWALVGVTAGLFIGAMPGLGSVNGVAILLPVTFLVPPSSAIIFLAAIYYGAMYGGAISSILLGIPGASTAVATTFDGRPMAQQGNAGLALIAAAVATILEMIPVKDADNLIIPLGTGFVLTLLL